MTINNKYHFGQIVYLVTDEEQCQRIVTGYIIRPQSAILYMLTCGTAETNHYEIEISPEKNILI